MLPKSHILYGGIFSFLIWIIFPSIGLINILILFLSSVLIDIDHYLVYVNREKDFSTKRASQYFKNMHKKLLIDTKNNKKIKAPLVIFHTIEFLLLFAVFSLFSKFAFFILIGLLFHSLLDIIDIYLEFGTLSIRYFSLISYFLRDEKNTIHL